MTTEFNIGDEAWFGYPNPTKGIVTGITINEKGVLYSFNGNGSGWKTVGKTENDAQLRGAKADLEVHERYIEMLKKEIAELEKKQ